MKKSCSGKESKAVKNEGTEVVLNASKKNTKNISDEQSEINKSNLGNATENEQLDFEKKTEDKTISISFNSPGNEKLQRTSARLAKLTSPKPAKWIENSFEIKQKDDTTFKNKSNKDNTENNKIPLKKTNSLAKKDGYQYTEEIKSLNSTNKKENLSSNLNESIKNNFESPKSIKKVQCMKTLFEENLKESNVLVCDSCEDSSTSNLLGKKRIFSSEKHTDMPKKFKMEGTNNNNNNNNNNSNNNNTNSSINNNKFIADSYTNNSCSSSHSSNNITDNIYSDENSENNNNNNNNNQNNNSLSQEMPLNSENVLKIEVELEKQRKDSQFNIRDIRTIMAECEFRNKKWKETFLKYKCPARWGRPTVKNCSEKWDGKQIPQKLLNRYQKYLVSKNLFHPVFFPGDTETTFGSNQSYKNVTCHLPSGFNAEFQNELENENREVSLSQELINNNDSIDSQIPSDNGAKMVLRTRNQYKPAVIEEDDNGSDESDEWTGSQKTGKKHRTNSKNKKSTVLNNQQLVLKMEKCNIDKKGDRIDHDDDNDLMGCHSLNQEEDSSKDASHSDTMVCPICSLKFPRQHIESHATECATKTYKD